MLPLGSCVYAYVCVCVHAHACVCVPVHMHVCVCIVWTSPHLVIAWLQMESGLCLLGWLRPAAPSADNPVPEMVSLSHTDSHTHHDFAYISFFFPHLKYIFNDFLKVNSYFFIWYCTCFNAILPNHPPSLSHRVQKTVLYICVSFAVLHTELSLPSF